MSESEVSNTRCTIYEHQYSASVPEELLRHRICNDSYHNVHNFSHDLEWWRVGVAGRGYCLGDLVPRLGNTTGMVGKLSFPASTATAQTFIPF